MKPAWPVRSVAALLLRDNIDTDIIMPKQYLKGIDRSGLADGLFRPLRVRDDGSPDPSFPLNHPPANAAQILVTGPNFGCGSSREHAVWGLRQSGIAALIGTSFAGIFRDNALNNNLLIVELESDEIARIATTISTAPETLITIDLEDQRVDCGDNRFSFAIDADRRTQILMGRDRIAETLAFAEQMSAFERVYWRRQPWLRPRPGHLADS
jgi:3-isopropylmalate/(R)-2-methylmalate dehydratase small subunit